MEQPLGHSQPFDRTTLVKQILLHSRTEPIVVGRGAPVSALPDAIATNPGCRTIAVVDEAGVLVGIIPVATVLRDLLFQIMPEELLANTQEPEGAAAMVKELHAGTAGGLMLPPLAISGEATAQEAAHKLHQAGLEGLPVVDEGQRVRGYLDLAEMVLAWRT